MYFVSLFFNAVVLVMQQQEINAMIDLLEKEISKLNEYYQILLSQNKKFPELKNVRNELKEAKEKLQRFKKENTKKS